MKIKFTSTSNTRDLGGLPIALGKWTKCNRIIRSDVPISLNDDEIDYLLNNKIDTVIGLRDKKHVELSPTCLQQISNFKCHNIALQKGIAKINSEDDLVKTYLKFCENFEEMQSIFKIIANASNGILIHCQEGKDRTGIVVAILLLLTDVPFEDIILDYSCSQIYLKKYIDDILKAFPDFPEYNYKTKPCYMEKFLHDFIQKYYSVNKYLHCVGLNEDEIYCLQMKLKQ